MDYPKPSNNDDGQEYSKRAKVQESTPSSSTPLTVSDKFVCTIDITRNGLRSGVEENFPSFQHSLTNSRSPPRVDSNSNLWTDNDYWNQASSSNFDLLAANVGLQANILESDFQGADLVSLLDPTNVMQETLRSPIRESTPMMQNSEMRFIVNPSSTTNGKEDDPAGSNLQSPWSCSNPSFPGTLGIDTQAGRGAPLITPTQEAAGLTNTVQNTSDPLVTGSRLLPKRRLVFHTKLSKSDLTGALAVGLLLAKHPGQTCPTKMTSNDMKEIEMHDGHEEGRIWSMQLTTSTTVVRGRDYRLNNTMEFTTHHSLQENDLLQIYWEDKGARYSARYIVEVRKHALVGNYIPLSLDQGHMEAKAWNLIISKKLTRTDVKLGPQSGGMIYLPKKQVKIHFPDLQGEEGMPMRFYDLNSTGTWVMIFKQLNVVKGGVTYILQNTRGLVEKYSLSEGDSLFIYKSRESDRSYALKTCT